ncbi:hypothetical protein [Amycolatopsis suaedae]|uniref:Uncharacterized protein n=1 Tax=Amycolatopsis suaedae TaxID=2510978 RepID=A0A4Q7J2M2_9PSEU|nr:hypothetical protein [Amycolatopsis suaedae]RZQ60204.1 hypothetical protein EWH70_29905 [Amycolatopsis suaedae]
MDTPARTPTQTLRTWLADKYGDPLSNIPDGIVLSLMTVAACERGVHVPDDIISAWSSELVLARRTVQKAELAFIDYTMANNWDRETVARRLQLQDSGEFHTEHLI